MAQALVQYDRKFNKHNVGATIGWEIKRRVPTASTRSVTLFATPYFTGLDVSGHQVSQGALYDYTYESSEAQLLIDDRYLFEVSSVMMVHHDSTKNIAGFSFGFRRMGNFSGTLA